MNLYENLNYVTFVLPSLNERNNLTPIIKEIIKLSEGFEIEIIVVDDNSKDGTQNLIRELSRKDRRIRLINRYGRYGLSSAIKEGCLSANGEIIAIMDADGQHEVKSLYQAINKLIKQKYDLVIGSRFLSNSLINGLSPKREKGSSIANFVARYSLSKRYRHLTDLMSGCIVFNRNNVIKNVERVDVNGFKFLYELLSVSRGILNCQEVPLNFLERKSGESKLDFAIVWDFYVSLIHSFFKRIIPRKAISFAFVGFTGVIVQLLVSYSLMWFINISFEKVLPIAVIFSASSNYLVNNWLTFRFNRLKNKALLIGLIKFLIVSSLPIVANVGLATSFYNYISPNTLLSQFAGIILVFIWNYAASSRFVWKS